MRVVVTGTRDGRPDVAYWLNRFMRAPAPFGKPDWLIVGCARGVDRQALFWAIENDVFFVAHSAEWERLGTAKAGGERNQAMVDHARPGDAVLAFPGPGSVGTYDCMRRATKAGIRVYRLPLAQGGAGRLTTQRKFGQRRTS